MISARTEQALEPLMRRCAAPALARSGESLERFDPVAGAEAFNASHAVVLSVVSHGFRIIVFLHYRADQAVRAHFARRAGVDQGQFGDEALRDALNECANLLCGGLNRELGRSMSQVGMSTPYVIEAASIRHLPLLKPRIERHWHVSVTGGPVLGLSLLLSDPGRHELDLEAPAPEAEDAAACGELELL